MQWQRLCRVSAGSDILIAHYPQLCSVPRCGERISVLSLKESTSHLFSVMVSVVSNVLPLIFGGDSLCMDGTPHQVAVRIILSGGLECSVESHQAPGLGQLSLLGVMAVRHTNTMLFQSWRALFFFSFSIFYFFCFACLLHYFQGL